jgi:hypothetical protein
MQRVWGNEPSHSQVNSHCGNWSPKWTPKFSECDFKGQTLNTNYDQKKGRESNWQFDARPLKVKNQDDFLMCRWCAIYRWKVLDKGYNFASNLNTIRGLHAKLWTPKVTRVLTMGISGLPFGSQDSHLGVPGQNAIWMWLPWRDANNIIRGKVVASPKSGAWWVLWIRVCIWLILTPKVLKLCTNQCVVWFVQIRVSE